MKKAPLTTQHSTKDLTKYKFIPPSKLFKKKSTNHFQSLTEAITPNL